MLNALIVEPKSISHRGIINDIQIIDNKVYSVSNDNTLKVWDKNLNLLDSIYEKKSGSFGNLYTIESNQNYILTAGITGLENLVFVHDKKSLKVIKELKKDFNAINKLKFSPNKKILAIISGSSIYFYDNNLNFLFDESFYKYESKYSHTFYDITFLDNQTVAFVNWDGYIIVYDIKAKKILKTKQLQTRLQSIIFVNNKLYVGGYDGYIYIFDKNLKSLNKIFLGSNFDILKLKASESFLAVAGGSGGFAVLKNDKLLFKKGLDFVKAVAIDGDNFYVGDRNILKKYKLSKLEIKSKTNIIHPYSLGAAGKYFYLNYQSIYDNLILGDDALFKLNYHTIDGNLYSYFGKGTDTLIIYEKKDKKEVARFVRDNSSGYRHRVVLWYKHYIISGGDYGKVYIYDIKSKSLAASLDDITDHIKDMSLYDDTLFVLDEEGDIRLYSLKKLQSKIKPYLTVTLFGDKSFLVRSGEYFYTDDLDNVVCLKPTKLNLVKTKCKANKEAIEKIISAQKPLEKKVKTINLSSNLPIEFDNKMSFLFNTSNYIILGNDTYYAWNKKTKKLIKIPKLPVTWSVGDVLEKDGFIYVLLTTGNIYKYDKDFSFISKSDLKPYYYGDYAKSYHLDRYKNFIVSRYKNTYYLFDSNLNPIKEIKYDYKTKKHFFWTFIDDSFYVQKGKTLFKHSFKSNKTISIQIDKAFIKTLQNRIVVKIKNSYYTLDKNLKKKFLFHSKSNFYFFNGKKSFYGVSYNNDILKCEGDEVKASSFLDKKYNIDILAGIAELKDEFMGSVLAFISDDKLLEYQMFGKTKNLKVLLKRVESFQKLFVGKEYIVALGEYAISIYSKNLKFIKKINLGFDRFYKLDGDKVYIKGVEVNYLIDLKTFKQKLIKKLPAINKQNKDLYYSKTDDYIYYKSFATKAQSTIFKLYETNKYIVATSYKKVYVYDKKLNLIGKLELDNRVNATYCTKDGIFYYAIYDKIFKYKLNF